MLKEFKKLNGGHQWVHQFPNGYGASVVLHSFSYGCDKGLFELAVLGLDGELTYDTTVTSDVLGYLTFERVADALKEISKLGEKND